MTTIARAFLLFVFLVNQVIPVSTVLHNPILLQPAQAVQEATPINNAYPPPVDSTATPDLTPISTAPAIEVTPSSTTTVSSEIAETPIPVSPTLTPTSNLIDKDSPEGLSIQSEKDYAVYGEDLLISWTLNSDAITSFYVPNTYSITWRLPDGVTPADSSEFLGLESSGGSEKKYEFSSMLSGQTSGKFTFHISEEAKSPIKISAAVMNGNEDLYHTELKLDLAEVYPLTQKGGKVSTRNKDISVLIPENMLDEDVQIRFRPISDHSRFPYMLGTHPVDIVVEGLNSKKELEHFNKPIQIQINYDETELNGNEKDLTLFYFDEETQLWRPWYTEIDPVNNIMTVETDHLTPTDYDIQNWQASQLPTMKDFQVASFTGSAAYSYPIQVPSGPAGLQPEIALTYNSQMVDSAFSRTQGPFVGMGWSLNLGSIERNMNGTDDYLEDDTYSLTVNGVGGTLLQIPGDVDGDPSTDDYRLENNNFWRIRHFRMPYITADSYLSDQSYWKVWDLSGNEYRFGGPVDTTNLTTINNTIQSARALFPWDGGCSEHKREVWSWMLYQVSDPSGNHLIFRYSADGKSNIASCGYIIALTKAIYPDNILYFANGSDIPSYRITFIRERRYDYDGSWNDRASRKFFGVERLREIQIEASTTGNGVFDKVIRKYVFTYAANDDTANIIFPNITWHNSEGDARNTTLIKIEEFGEDGVGSLPATTFKYDSMHMVEANNGYGGKVNFTYESWAESQGDKIYSAGSGEGLPIGWQSSVVNVGTWNTYFRPGQAYYVKFTAQTWAPEEVKLGFNWYGGVQYSSQITYTPQTGDHEYLFAGWVYIPSVTPTGVDLHFVFECAVNACYPHTYTIWSVLTRYRVETKTLTDTSITPNAEYQYDYAYGDAASNNINISAAASTTNPYVKPNQEFRGHPWVRVTAPDNSTTTTYFYQDDDQKGQVQKSEVRNASGMLLSMVENTYGMIDNWAISNLPIKENGPAYTGFEARWVFIDSIDQKTYDLEDDYLGTRQEFDYLESDQGGMQYGMVTQITESSCSNHSSDCTSYRLTKTIYSPNVTSTTSYFVQRPVTTDIYSCPGGTCTLANENLLGSVLSLYTISGKPFLLSGQKTLLRFEGAGFTNPRYQDTAFEYDNWGNQNKVVRYTIETDKESFGGAAESAQATITCYGEFGGTTAAPTCENDIYHTYPAWQQDALGHVTRYEYDKSLGLLMQSIDPNGAVSSFSYDLYGRILKVVYPYDSSYSPSIQISYNDAAPFWTEFRQKIDSTTSITLRKFYNGLGDLVQTQEVGVTMPDGKCQQPLDQIQDHCSVIVDYHNNYESLSGTIFHVTKQSMPYVIQSAAGYYSGAGQNWAASYSDALGRVVKTIAADGQWMNYSYFIEDRNDGQTIDHVLNTVLSEPWQNGVKETHTLSDAWQHVLQVNAPEGPILRYQYNAKDLLVDVFEINRSTGEEFAHTALTYDLAGRKTGMTDPDMGAWTYTYDALGNLLTQTDAKSQTLWMKYDALNRLLEKRENNQSGTLLASFTYDQSSDTNAGIGQRTGMSDSSGSAAWEYDARGRVIHESKQVVDGALELGTYHTWWNYYSNNSVHQMVYPNNETVNYAYNASGALDRVYSIQDETYEYRDYVSRIEYDENSRAVLRVLGNDIEQRSTYYPWTEQGGRLNSILTQKVGGQTYQNLSYTYDAGGNITQLTDAAAVETTTFTYDALNRLDLVSGAYSEDPAYDSNTGVIASRNGVTYTYADPAHVHAVTATGDGRAFGYDLNGNMIARSVSGDSYTLAYDEENRLTNITGGAAGARYVYDGDGKRVISIEGETRTVYIGNYFEAELGAGTTFPVHVPELVNSSLPFLIYFPVIMNGEGTGTPPPPTPVEGFYCTHPINPNQQSITWRMYYYADGQRAAMRVSQKPVPAPQPTPTPGPTPTVDPYPAPTATPSPSAGI
ncbi:MAG: SpvB/TcaC N-terminal domain-containing protein, partial [Anaerolineaceae bacterium]